MHDKAGNDVSFGRPIRADFQSRIMWEGPLCPDPLCTHGGSGRKGPSHIGGLG